MRYTPCRCRISRPALSYPTNEPEERHCLVERRLMCLGCFDLAGLQVCGPGEGRPAGAMIKTECLSRLRHLVSPFLVNCSFLLHQPTPLPWRRYYRRHTRMRGSKPRMGRRWNTSTILSMESPDSARSLPSSSLSRCYHQLRSGLGHSRDYACFGRLVWMTWS